MEKEKIYNIREKYTYVKVLLYIYPQLNWIIQQERQRVCNGALFSYKCDYDADRLVDELLDKSMHCDRLNYLQIAVRRVLKGLTEKQKAVVEYCYWHKKQRLKELIKNKRICLKTVYRSQETVLSEIAFALTEIGVDYAWFRENVLCYDWGVDVFRKVLFKQETWKNLPKPQEKRAIGMRA